MLRDIAIMLVLTFGLSRLFLKFLPAAITNKRRAALGNIGSLLAVALLYGALVVAEPDVAGILLIAIPFAAACQTLWYWRDVSKLAKSLIAADGSQSTLLQTSMPHNSVDGEDQLEGNRERWDALIRYDGEICDAADQLRPYGDNWVTRLGQAFFALNEDRNYLSNIVTRLIEEAERDKASRWASPFRQTADGNPCTDEFFKILREAQKRGYVLGVEKDKTFTERRMAPRPICDRIMRYGVLPNLPKSCLANPLTRRLPTRRRVCHSAGR